MTKKRIVLEDHRDSLSHIGEAFRVKKITNSVVYRIDQYISEGSVKILCRDNSWTVDIVGKLKR